MTDIEELPKYRCHKEVWALKIRDLLYNYQGHNGALIISEAPNSFNVFVDREYVEKHSPEIGGYYVKYANGYESYSPAKAFESGYTLIND